MERTVYGKYSLGSGTIIPDKGMVYKDIDHKEVIDAYVSEVEKNIGKACIPLKDLKQFHVMNVGTGRETIALNNLGAKKVSHFDLGKENVERLNEYIKKNNLQRSLSSTCADLVEYSLPKEHYDFVYLHGIIQHFSHVGNGLINCLQSIRPAGFMWMYFYRSGTFLHFMNDMLSSLANITKLTMKEVFIDTCILYSNQCKQNYKSSTLLDNIFSPVSLYQPETYIDFIEECGFKIVSSSKLNPYGGRAVNHEFAWPSVVLMIKREKQKNLQLIDTNPLSPENSLNQLGGNIYGSNDSTILRTIECYNNLKNILLEKKVRNDVIISLIYRLFEFSRDPWTKMASDIDHRELQGILQNACLLIDEEY